MKRRLPTTRRLLPCCALLTFLALLQLPVAALAAPAGAITASVDAQDLTVGDPFWYTVKWTLPAGSKPEMPGNDVSFGTYEIRDYRQDEETLPDGSRQIALRYQLVGFTVGESQIADFKVRAKRLVDSKEQTDVYLAPPVTVTINSVLPPKDAQMKPICGPLFLRPWWHSWLWPALIALALLALLFLGIWLWTRRRSKAVAELQLQLPPQEAAYSALQALRDGKLIPSGSFKAFYSELGDIMRRWLWHRAGIPAMEETTGIIRYDLRKSDLPDEWQRELIALLSRGDLVKFAKWVPDDSVAWSDLDTALELLRTGAIPEPEPGGEDTADAVEEAVA